MLLPAQIDRFIRMPGADPRFHPAGAGCRCCSSTGCFPGPSRWSAMACSAFCATARWRSTRRPKISSGPFETALKRRRRGSVIRLTVNGGMAPDLREFLRSRLAVAPDDVFVREG